MQRDAQTLVPACQRGYRDVTGTRSTRRGRKRLLRDTRNGQTRGRERVLDPAHPHARPAPGRRRRIVAPDGSEIARVNQPQPDGTLVKAVAQAWR